MADFIKSLGITALEAAEARIAQLEADAELAWKTPHVGGVMIACFVIGLLVGVVL